MATKRKKKETAKTQEELMREQMSNTLNELLGGADVNYAEAKNTAKSFSGEKVPEGKYEMQLSNIKFNVKEKDGDTSLSLQRTFTVLTGENEGMSQTDFMRLNNPTGLSFAMQFIMIMGYEIPEVPGEWADIVEELQEESPEVLAEVVHSGDFVNVRVTELLEDGEEDEDDDGDDDELLEELEEMTRAELKAFIKEEGLDIKVMKKMSDEDIVDAILEAMDEDEDEE